MDITTENFKEQLPFIRKTIQEASFFSLDAEFTGLTSERNIFPFDTPEEVYLKTIENSADFVIIQLGLCAFTIDHESGQVTYKCYNFYCFPKGRYNVFGCQGESLRFLAENGFDFNKLFRSGLSYCCEADEERMRADLKNRQEQRIAALQEEAQNDENGSVNMVPVPPASEKMLSEISERIERFLESEDKDFTITNCNGFERKLVYQLIESKYSKLISGSSVPLANKHKGILIERKRSKEEEQEFEANRIIQENEDLNNNVGLSLVLQELSKARKLIIGHNMLLDLLFVLRQFFRPLPYNYQEFKKMVRELFPLLLDTKYLCTNAELKVHVNSSVLEHVFDSVQKEPFEMPHIASGFEEHKYATVDKKLHDAGYDAYLTGQCFLGLISYFKVDLQNMLKDPTLKAYFNRIFILRATEVNYIYTYGKEPSFSREHIYFITFPENWRSTDILLRFRNYGQIHINWVNNNSAFVVLHNKDYAAHVIKTIDKSSAQFTICTLNQFQAKHVLELNGDTIVVVSRDFITPEAKPKKKKLRCP
ncbi:poly(A)-specific ribonuclease PARN-like isoform X2 [Topomyia yanbarensis]|uniref:poly(A)-specific ribonuclease PARN-like isoform X2 n=1 Tax=Topomyia yanbarensis TaxID=2498891 RepID=UPI00273AC80E|nr:poly(A)-specific ribonuclease PARN-like isoform X2 [Topomyia yanbarensis]